MGRVVPQARAAIVKFVEVQLSNLVRVAFNS